MKRELEEEYYFNEWINEREYEEIGCKDIILGPNVLYNLQKERKKERKKERVCVCVSEKEKERERDSK